MYPAGELNLLAARKALVRVRIAEHRWECAAAAEDLARPLRRVDHLLAWWRRVSPMAKVVGLPALMIMARKLKLFSKLARIASLSRVLPMILRTARTVAQW